MKQWRILVLAALAAALLAACGTSKVSTVQVEGVVTNITGVPSAGVRVLIPGKSVVTTDSNGRFVFEDVTTPYTLIVELDTDKYMIYEGVTRTDPQLSVTTNTGSFKATIEGEVSGTTTGDKLGLQLVSQSTFNTKLLTAADTATSYSLEATLLKPTATADLYALEWTTDADGNALDYVAYGRYPSTLDLAAGATLSNRGFSLTTIAATHDLAVSTSGPSGLSPSAHFAGIRFADQASLAFPLHAYIKFGPSGNSYTTRSPNLTDVQMMVGASYSDGGNLFSFVWESVPATATSHSLTAPDPVTLTAPANGSTVSVGSSLGWEGPEGALYTAYLQGDLGLTFITADTSVTLPDLSPFGVSYGTNDYAWQVDAFRFDGIMAEEVDQVVEPGKPSLFLTFFATIFASPPSESGYLVSSPQRTLTVH